MGKDGIKPNPKAIESVKNWKVPTTIKKIQQFLGLCNYYRQYICRFSDIASPLSQLTRKDVPFNWTKSCAEAFDKLKRALTSAPVLGYPCSGGTFILDTDASNIGIRGILSQVQDNKERVIAYASKKLDRTQQRYSVTRRELLAAVTFMHQFRHYLLGRQFILRTDHSSLRSLFEFKNPQGQLARWIESLSQYSFTIQYRPGTKHINADTLSRKPSLTAESCQHLTDEDHNCIQCQEWKTQWSDFREKIDDVQNLTKCDKPLIRNLKESETENQNLDVPWLSKYSTNQMSIFQKEDPDFKHLHDWFDCNKIPDRDECASLSPAARYYWLKWENLKRIGGVIYHIWKEPKTNQENHRLLIPTALRKELMISCHDTPCSGHAGTRKSIDKMKKHFTWHKMGKDVKIHIQQCSVCNKWKTGRKPKAALVKYTVGNPLNRIGIDIVGPLPLTQKKNRYLLVIGDYFTRWMEAYPISNQKTEIIAQKLVMEFISRFGIPLELHSDQGTNFQSELMNSICSLLEISKTRTTAYHPSSNGMVERLNRTLTDMIKSFVNNNRTNWDEHINLLLAAYRSIPHPATRFTPNYLMLGREINLSLQIVCPLPA